VHYNTTTPTTPTEAQLSEAGDAFVNRHITAVKERLLERNLLRIVEPFSSVQIGGFFFFLFVFVLFSCECSCDVHVFSLQSPAHCRAFQEHTYW
jgi:hypothetical protein